MTIASTAFGAFVTVCLAVYHGLPPRLRVSWLLLASYAFYGLSAPWSLPILLIATAVNAILGRRLVADRRAAWLWIGVALNAGVVIALRWSERGALFAGPIAALGISFVGLQAVSYLADLRTGKLSAPASVRDVAVYLAYFPKIVAGPVEPAHGFLPQLAAAAPVDDETLSRCLSLIVVGMTRKLVLADPLATLIPSAVFTQPSQFGGPALAAALGAYAFVLYNDFAGYTSIVRGVSRLFGIELTRNFAQPFFSRSFTEFWGRWHASLTNWLRVYIYLPLSLILLRRDRRLWNVPNIVVPPMAAMLSSGLWHGGTPNMLLWGGLHGVFLTVERVVRLARPGNLGETPPLWRQLLAVALVWVLSCLALVAFRMDLDVALLFWRRLFTAQVGVLPSFAVVPFMAASLWIDSMEWRRGDDAPFSHWPRPMRVAAAAAALALCFLATRGGPAAPFVYQRF